MAFFEIQSRSTRADAALFSALADSHFKVQSIAQDSLDEVYSDVKISILNINNIL